MAITNRARIDKMFEVLTAGLKPFVEKHMQAAFQGYWPEKISEVVNYPIKKNSDGAVIWDEYLLLRTIDRFWADAISRTLGKSERSYVNELLDVRNRWAHRDGVFSSDDTDRYLDTAKRLLTAISASTHADEIQKILFELRRTVFDEQRRNETRKVELVKGQPVAGLKAWREVITPHRDVSSGNYMNAEFAADLAQVYRGDAAEEYQNPKEFFARTFLTQGLKDLLASALSRLGNKKGDPVIQLQTNFGGGKTHSMLALYHLFSGKRPGELPGIEPIVKNLGIDAIPKVKRAVLVGTSRGPADVISQEKGIQINTLWGDLAWQLGGADAYKMVAEADRQSISPGSDVLVKLFDRFGPALILIDEWVAYVRQLYRVEGLPGGSFDANLTFAQSLTEAAKASKQVLLVASLPASNMEMGAGGEGGEKSLERLKHTFGRIDAGWRPATADEGFEIVRRRLFEPISAENYPHRDAVIQKFSELYRENPSDFPSGCAEGDYKRRMEAAYPIHPELFDKLYSVWGSLEKFQKTRGVLRLMAMVINYLWEQGDSNLLILPGSVPIHHVQGELNRYTEDTWQAIIHNDIDSDQAIALKIDRDNQRLGKLSATRKVARTIFLGSAPTHKEERGLEVKHINLGAAQPGESIPNYGDALNKLRDSATYLHFEGQRYWFSTRANVTRLASDRAEQIEQFKVHEEIVGWLKKELTRGDFSGIHIVPKSTDDVPDETDTRLVILGPAETYSNKNPNNKALLSSKQILQTRGTSQRIYRNTLIFVAPDEQQLPQLEQSVRNLLAWESILKDEDPLGLTPQLKKQSETRVKTYRDTISAGLRSTWIWVISPRQASAQDEIEWTHTRVNGQEDLVRRVGKKMIEDEVFISVLGPKRLQLDLDRYLWKGVNHLNTKQLCEYYASYLYLPKLRDKSVLQKCINDGLSKLQGEYFGYADAFNQETNRYEGLVFGGGLSNAIIDADSVLVKPDVAQAQMQAEVKPSIQPGETSTGEARGPTTTQPGGTPAQPSKKTITKFVGSVELNPDRVGANAGRITDEVLSHLTVLRGAKVSVTMEIQIEVPNGIDESVQRTVLENCNTLKFKFPRFE